MSHNEDQALIDIMDCGNVAFDKVSSDIDKGVKLGHCQEVIAQMGGLNGWNSVAALKQDDKPEDRTHLLKPYYVTIKEDEFNGFTGFECQAEDDSHAREQAENAYPAGKILSVKYLDHQHRYVPRGGLHCPCCGSDNISGNEWNADAGHATQEVGCDNCNAQWLDEYTLTGVIVQDGGDGTPGDSPDLSADDKFVCVNCGKTGDIEDSVETDDAVLVCLNCQVDVISNTEDWQQEVQNSDTKLGFAEWMMHRRESKAHDVTANFGETGILAEVHSDDRVLEIEFDATTARSRSNAGLGYRACGILVGYDSPIYPRDTCGCLLPIGHSEAHEFIATDGKRYRWETDWECECEHCMSGDGDFCTIYSEVPNLE